LKRIKKQIIEVAIFSFCLLLLFSFRNNPSGNEEESQKKLVQFKIAAYNVKFSDKGTAKEIGEALKPFDFDVVCFSEAPGGNWTKEVGAVMGLNHVVVGRYSTVGHKDKYKTIASRTPLYDYEEILMADTLHTVTKATTKISDKEISIYSVHFPFGWRATGKITAFVNYLKERQSNEIAVVQGDFNFIRSSSEYRSIFYEMFVDIGMEVSWKDLGIDVTQLSSMISASNRDTKGRGRVIDHIMYNPEKIKALDGQIMEMEKPLSDHKPVWALLELK